MVNFSKLHNQNDYLPYYVDKDRSNYGVNLEQNMFVDTLRNLFGMCILNMEFQRKWLEINCHGL